MSDIKKLRKLYAIYDRKREAYLGVMEKINHNCAIRDFEHLTKSEQSMIKNAPEDFKLDFIGTFDEETGELKAEKTTLIEAKEVLENV